MFKVHLGALMPSILCRDRNNVVLSGEMWKPELFQDWVFTVIFLVKLLIMTFDLRIYPIRTLR